MNGNIAKYSCFLKMKLMYMMRMLQIHLDRHFYTMAYKIFEQQLLMESEYMVFETWQVLTPLL